MVAFGVAALPCMALMLYEPGSYPLLICLALVFLMVCFQSQRILLEVTPAVVRARQGRFRGRPDLEVDRVEICRIDYCPGRLMFRGTHGQSLMAPYPFWTLEQVVQVADVLDVPVYDRRGKFRLRTLTREELAEGRLVKSDSSADW